MFTNEQDNELWDRWQAGESSRLIARALGTNATAVRSYLAVHGGVRPASRRRSGRHLTAAEREEVYRGVVAGLSSRVIAARIGCSASTVSRERGRNGGRARYRAALAESAAWDRARRPKRPRLASHSDY